MRDAGLQLELAIAQDRCLTRRPKYLGAIERRRRFNVEQKLTILAEAIAPEANLSAIARRHGL
jgi:transposase-like protein